MSKKIVIVGGVAGGATAAARISRLDKHAHVVVFERGEHVSYANCGLPYYIGGVIKERDALFVQTKEKLTARYGFDIRALTEVTAINRDQKTVSAKNLATGETYEERYDVLVLSPGAKPVVPPIPGINEAANAFTLRNVPDTDKIHDYIEKKKPQNAVIIGGGFIGVEMAESLRERHLNVTLIEKQEQVMAPLDPELAALVHDQLRLNDVNLVLGKGVSAFEQEGTVLTLEDGTKLQSDLTILAIGVRPENELAKAAGLDIGETGGIVVNQFLQTKDEAIYAIGDAIEVMDRVSGRSVHIPLAWPANRQGRIVADNIFGKKTPYKGTMGTGIAKVFDVAAAATGNNEKTLKKHGIQYAAVHIHPSSNAGYYPGGMPLAMKLTFDPENGTIFGAQAVGAKGADKRIDVIATAIAGGLTVHDLQDLELAYAPPFSSAKDPVNMLGYAAANIVDGEVQPVYAQEVDRIVQNGGLLIDVRDPMERDAGFIEGSVNIPLNDLKDRLAEVPKDKPVYVSCQVGMRGYLASTLLRQEGYDVHNVSGGYKTYAAMKRDEKAKSDQVKITAEPVKESTGGQKMAVNIEGPITATEVLDCAGLQCPGPIAQVFKKMGDLTDGDVLEVKVTDPGFIPDAKAWCDKTGNTYLKHEKMNGMTHVYLQKGSAQPIAAGSNEPAGTKGATMIVFDQDLDKAIASFIIATGAAAMGKPVTMFFTFWGLNVLRKDDIHVGDKDFMDKMFGKMMPKGTKKLPISNMNMGGMGAKMIRQVMENKNVDSLETLMKNAMEMGVNIVACAMSMDVMGIREEELIEGVEIGGVASYLGKAEDSNINLFI